MFDEIVTHSKSLLKNWWMTDYFSFKGSQPSNFYIQAVEIQE